MKELKVISRPGGYPCPGKRPHQPQLKGTADARIRQKNDNRIEAVEYVCLAKVMVKSWRMVKGEKV